MTIYEETLMNLEDELVKLYRFEGYNSYSYHSPTSFPITSNYIYFSKNQNHHFYYVDKKLKKMISKEISNGYLNKKNILNPEKFNFLINGIENYLFNQKLVSIEFSCSNLINMLLRKNTIKFSDKEKFRDRRIERVDYRKYGGGYGFCDEWLKILQSLTYFKSYQRITKENIIDFLYRYRQNIIETKKVVNPVEFLLKPEYKVVQINQDLFSDFSKYELINSLQAIVEKKLYLPSSIFCNNSQEIIKKIMQQYSAERENILALIDKNYKKQLINK